MNENITLRASILRESKDHESWQKYLEYIQVRPDVTDEKRDALLTIYRFLRKELGEDYLGRHYRDGRNLVNNCLWSLGNDFSQLTWLYNSLHYFKGRKCNYEKLVGLLKQKERCNIEGVPFLIVGDSLRKAGFEVMFEPQVTFAKKPDLKIENPATKETLYIEVSKLGESQRNEEISRNYHTLMNCFIMAPPLIPFSGRQLQIVPHEQMNNLKEMIASAKEKALSEKRLIEIQSGETDGCFEFAVAHSDKFIELESLEKERKYGSINNISGIPLNLNYTYRIGHRITTEAKQLPKDYPGLLYIPIDPMFAFFGIGDYTDFIGSVKASLSELPHIIGACFYSGIGIDAKETLFSDGDFFERKIVHDDILQEVLFIKNPKFGLKVTDDTTLKLEKSFSSIFC
jgi:hypothetical protein